MESEILTTSDEKPDDRSALLMMLTYVEAECRRLGVGMAAEYAAMAAAAMLQRRPVPARADGVPLH